MASFPQCLPNQATYQRWCDSISYNITPIEHLCTPKGCQKNAMSISNIQQHFLTQNQLKESLNCNVNSVHLCRAGWCLSSQATPQQRRRPRHFRGSSEKHMGETGSKMVKSYGGFLKWGYPQIIHFNRIFRFHCKPSILGYIHVYILICPILGPPIWNHRVPNLASFIIIPLYVHNVQAKISNPTETLRNQVSVAAISAFCRFSPISSHHRDGMQPFVQFRTKIVLPRGRYSAKMFSRGRLLVLMNIVFRNLTMTKFWLKHACNIHMPSCFLLQPITKGCESYIFVGWKRWSFRQPKSEPHRCILGSNSTSSNSSISMGSISPISGNPSISSSVLPLHRRQVTWAWKESCSLRFLGSDFWQPRQTNPQRMGMGPWHHLISSPSVPKTNVT